MIDSIYPVYNLDGSVKCLLVKSEGKLHKYEDGQLTFLNYV